MKYPARNRASLRATLALGVSALALGATASRAQEACPSGSPGPVCEIHNAGASGAINGNPGNFLIIRNDGTITGGTAINLGGAVALNLVNGPDGVVTGTGGDAVLLNSRTVVPLLFFGIRNQGTIEGNVSFVEPTPLVGQAMPAGLYYYISDGGTLDGDLQLGTGFSTAYFLQRGADSGVTGTISAGGGADAYIRSYAGIQSVALGDAPLPATFELEGIEAFGANSVITLTGSGSGIVVAGTGAIINNATISAPDTSGLYPMGANVVLPAIGTFQPQMATFPRTDPAPGTPNIHVAHYGEALTSFTNNGTVNGDIRLATANCVNTGDINQTSGGVGSVITGAADRNFVFSNSGTIEMAFTGGRAATARLEAEIDGETAVNAALRIRSAMDTTDPGNVEIANTGDILGGIDVRVVADNLTFDNHGILEAIDEANYFARAATIVVGELARGVGPDPVTEFNAGKVTVRNHATGDVRGSFYLEAAADELVFANSGIISWAENDGGIALYIDQELHEGAGDASRDAAHLDFSNTGMIDGGVEIDVETKRLDIANSGDIIRTALGTAQRGLPLFGGVHAMTVTAATAGGQVVIVTNTGTIEGEDHGGSGLLIESEAGDDDLVGSPAANGVVSVVNEGRIAASGGATLTPGALIGRTGTVQANQAAALGIDSEATGNSTILIENKAGAVIEASGDLRVITPTGPDSFTYQVLAGTDGSHMTAIAAVGQTVHIINSGVIKGGAGTDYSTAASPVFIEAAIGQPNGYLAGAIHTSGDEAEDGTFLPGEDWVMNEESGVIIGSIDLNAGDDVIDNLGSITGDVFLREGNDVFRNAGAYEGHVDMGAGDDYFVQLLSSAALFNGTVDGGAGYDRLAFDITGSDGLFTQAFRDRFTGFENFTLIGTANVTVVAEGDTSIGADTEIVVAEGENAIQGSAESQTIENHGRIHGHVNLGGGDNSFVNDGSITGNLVTGDGANSIVNGAGAVLNGAVVFGNGGNNLENNGTITGPITGGSGSDVLVNGGTIAGDVDLGEGDDSFVLAGGTFAGTASGGDGHDSLAFATTGTEESPTVIDGSQFTDFEELENNSGVNRLTGTIEVENVNVTGGALFGTPGSTITGNVLVNGGTFGSAGTIVGGVMVTGGTLAPGASPGIMTVYGDLVIGDGTVTVFELVPEGQSDLIIVEGGSVSIGDDTTLHLTGSLTPGDSRDLILVNGGGTIAGDFTTVNLDPGIVGVVRKNAGNTALQLLGVFVTPEGAAPQAAAGIEYVNDLLVGGSAGAALLAAFPNLMTNGAANEAAFLRITGEAYASAAQLGVEQGLTLARAARSGINDARPGSNGVFVFAEAIGDWLKLKADGGQGTSRAKSHSYGMLGGLGLAFDNGMIGAFAGYVDSRQTIRALDARTDADGAVAGVTGRVNAGGFGLSATLAYDWSEARTRRVVPGGAAVASGDYRLRSLVLDAAVDYRVALGRGWQATPQVGITHVSTRRGAATEAGSAAFDLAVAADRTKATFTDARLRFARDGEATVEPWLEIGVRHQLSGEVSDAAAAFIGQSATFTVIGAERSDTQATLGLGAVVKLAPNTRLHGAYQGEFGGGHAHAVNVGLGFGF